MQRAVSGFVVHVNRTSKEEEPREEGSHRSRMFPSKAAKNSTDEELVYHLASGEGIERALSVLYDRYSPTVYSTGFKLLADRALAEEVVQEVFLKVWRSAGTFDPLRASFSTWLYRITRNAAVDFHRRRSRTVPSFEEGGEKRVANIRDSSKGPEKIIDDSWLAWRVMRSLEALDEPCRQVIELSYFQGLTQREIAQRTGLPLGTVKSRTTRALKRLRQELGASSSTSGEVF